MSCLFLMTALVCEPAPVTRLPGSASGPCFAVPHSPWPCPFAPRAPPQPRLLCSLASLQFRAGPTSPSPSSSATSSGLPDAVPATAGGDSDGDFPVPRWKTSAHAGSATTRGQSISRDHDTDHLAFCWTENIGAPNLSYAAQYLAYALPYQCFACSLTTTRA